MSQIKYTTNLHLSGGGLVVEVLAGLVVLVREGF